MKRFLPVVCIAAFLMLLLTSTAWAGDAEVTIRVNNKVLSTEIPPMIVANRTMVPMRTICEALGVDVIWDQRRKTVVAVKSGNTVRLPVGSYTAHKNDEQIQLDVPAMLVEGRTLIPARFISEAFGASVVWENETRTVKVFFAELRDKKTALEILEASTEALDAVSSYKFDGLVTSSIKATPYEFGLGTLASTMEMTGAFRKPQETYIKLTASDGDGLLSEESETYTNGTDYYTRSGDTAWEKIEEVLPAQLFGEGVAESPSGTFSQLEGVPTLAAFGDDVLINGTRHYTIYVKLDPEGFKEFTLKLLLDAGGEDVTDEDTALLRDILKQIFETMRFDIFYKVFVDAETLVADRVDARTIVKMTIEGEGSSTIAGESSTRLYDINMPVEMPDVSAPAQ